MELKFSKDFIIDAIKINPYALLCVIDKFKDDFDVVSCAV